MTEKLVRGLGLIDASSLVVGTIIGTGVFLKTAVMAQELGSPFWVMSAWIFAGILSLAGALTYAELGGLFPQAGGEYVFLREGYGRLPAFLYGWMRFWIASPGTIAAYAVGAATFLGGCISLDFVGGRVGCAVLMITFFSLLNCLTVTFGGRLQSFMTLLKVVMMAAVIIGIFFFSNTGGWHHWSSHISEGTASWGAFGASVLAAMWAYDGWNNLPMIAGEVRNPERNVPLSLVAGMFVILFIYGLVNLAYFYAMPFAEILSSNSSSFPDALPVATKATETFMGDFGIKFISLAFVFSALGAMNGSILTGSRVPYAMAVDGLFFSKLASVSKVTQVPVWSVLAQGLLSCVLAFSGTFDQLTDYVIFASWIFYGTVTSLVFVFRKKYGKVKREYSTWGYPWVPAIFVFLAALLLINTLITSPRGSCIGLAMILAGVPVYKLFHRTN
jgi:APA family basic amino acid/polyamine antiporter